MDLILDIAVFLIASTVVIIAALGLVKTADIIASATGWGRVWVGSLLLGGATSLPELVTVTSAVHFLSPVEGSNLALGTVFGANMMNVSKLTLIIALLGGRNFFQILSNEQKSLNTENEDTIHLPKFLDPDGDGKVSAWEWAQSILIIVGVIFCCV